MGIRQQDLLVHTNDDGSGLAQHMSQFMEHMIQLMKRHCKRNCNHRSGWQTRLMKFLDCVTIGAVKHDLIDFKKCKVEFDQKKQMIYQTCCQHARSEDLI